MCDRVRVKVTFIVIVRAEMGIKGSITSIPTIPKESHKNFPSIQFTRILEMWNSLVIATSVILKMAWDP